MKHTQKTFDETKQEIAKHSSSTGEMAAFRNQILKVMESLTDTFVKAAVAKLTDATAVLARRSTTLAKVAGGGTEGAIWYEHGSGKLAEGDSILDVYERTLKTSDKDSIEREVAQVSAATLDFDSQAATYATSIPTVDLKGMVPDIASHMATAKKLINRAA
eukprot:10108042-Prorocentrum_lima.AAC.1